MATAAQKSGANQPLRSFFSSKFFLSWLALVATLIAIGIGGFLSLTASGPLTLVQGAQRPIAAATAFVPANSPFTLSLLTHPDKLVALQQAIAATASNSQASQPTTSRPQAYSPTASRPSPLPLDPQQRNRREVEQIKQSLLDTTGLDYDRDLQPWMGDEVTFAFTDTDLDQDDANGQQSGYLLAIEIAPAHQQQAREFLQLFWQRQSLAKNPPQSEQISGVRVLYAQSNSLTPRPSAITAASALVGDRFVMFANDVRVLRQSIRTAQTTTNLAQNRAYRQTVAQLPERKIALAYLDTALLSNSPKITPAKSLSDPQPQRQTPHTFTAVGLGITKAGITADIRQAATTARTALSRQLVEEASPKVEFDLEKMLADDSVSLELLFIDALKFLPADTALALASHQLSELKPALTAIGIPENALSVLFESVSFQPGQAPLMQGWAMADYAFGQMNTGKDSDWILAVAPDLERRGEGVARLDVAAQAKGYSAVPVDIDGREVIAWTRLSAGSRAGSRGSSGSVRGRSSGNALETDILGLHLQQDAYEVFAGSVAAMESAIAAPSNSLLRSARFAQAIKALTPTDSGYLYADWSAIKPALVRSLPVLQRLEAAARPLVSHVDTIAATREGESASLFVRLAP